MSMKKTQSDQSGPSLIGSKPNPRIAPPRLAYNLGDTAAALSMSELSVRRLVKRKLIRPSRALRTLVFPVREIERFLATTTTDDRP